MLFHCQEGEDDIQLVGFFLELTDQGQIGHNETGGRLGHNILAEEPVDQTVVELEVGRQVGATQNRPAQDLGEMLIAVKTILALGQQQSDIGIVRPGQVVAHEQVGIRVLDADPLVITDFTFDRRRPVADVATGARAERTIGCVETGFGTGAETRLALGTRQTLLVQRQDGHRLNQRLNDEELLLVFRIGELEVVHQLGNAMLNLDPGIDFHEVVTITVDDTLEGRSRVKADGHAKTLGFIFHALEHLKVGFQGLGLLLEAGSLGFLDLFGEGFLGYGDFQQLLLMHLQGTVTATERDGPLAVAEQLDFVVTGLLDIQLDQNVLVVADTVCLDFEQDLSNQLRCIRSRLFDVCIARVLLGQQ